MTRGLNTHRIVDGDNPKERRFADAWDTESYGRALAHILAPEKNQRHPDEPSERDRVVAATVIQWLGSPVGQCFLRAMGYETR